MYIFMFLNYGISAHANVYMQPLKCGISDIFACHIENRTYGFLVFYQQSQNKLFHTDKKCKMSYLIYSFFSSLLKFTRGPAPRQRVERKYTRVLSTCNQYTSQCHQY